MVNHPYSDEPKVPGDLSTNEKDLRLPAEVVTMIAETVVNTLKPPSTEESKKTKQEHEQGREKGKEIASHVSAMSADETSLLALHVAGNTGVMVAPGQKAEKAEKAVYEQKVKEQVEQWEKEWVRMKAYGIYVEDGVVKKRLKSKNQGMLMLSRANAARAKKEDQINEAKPENEAKNLDETVYGRTWP